MTYAEHMSQTLWTAGLMLLHGAELLIHAAFPMACKHATHRVSQALAAHAATLAKNAAHGESRKPSVVPADDTDPENEATDDDDAADKPDIADGEPVDGELNSADGEPNTVDGEPEPPAGPAAKLVEGVLK